MKVWELEEGKEYKVIGDERYREVACPKYKLVCGTLMSYFVNEWTESSWAKRIDVLKDLEFEEYTPPTDWSKVKVDTKVYVRDNAYCDWKPRYFAKYKNGIFYAWMHGATSWSAESEQFAWAHYKLAEESEE